VPDPYYGEEPGYHKVYELIDAAAQQIIGRYAAGNSTPLPGKERSPNK
jgi:protein-tyrosine phosphatase